MRSKSIGCLGYALLSIVGFIVGFYFFDFSFDISDNLNARFLSKMFRNGFIGGVIGVVVFLLGFNWLNAINNSKINSESNYIGKDKEVKELRDFALITEEEYQCKKDRLMDS